MRSLAIALWAAVAVFFTALAAPALAAPLEVYGRLPMIEQVAISPDGSLLAYAVTDGENRMVIVRRRADGEVIARIAAGDRKLRDIGWAGNAYILITSSQTRWVSDVGGASREYLMATSFELATGKQRGLMERAGSGAMNIVTSTPIARMVDGRPTAIVEGVGLVNNRGRIGLFSVDLETGRTKNLSVGTDNTTDFLIDATGEPVALAEFQTSGDIWRLRIRKGDNWQVVDSRVVPIGRPALRGLSQDGRSVLVSGREDGRQVLRAYPLDGGPGAVMTIGPFDSILYDGASLNMIGYYALVGDERRYTFLDARTDAVWKAIGKAYAGDLLTLESASDDRRKVVLRVDRKEAGPGFAIIDLDARTSDWLGDAYSGLKPADISPVTTVSYKAADGLTINGYLTLPAGRPAQKLPLVVLPHGGPASRDALGFDWWAQALASRGYAVLQPNFRGSDGLGESFREAGYGEWGKKMQTDLSDGVRDLAAKGIIDPSKVCIVGASYGGYAALAGATIDTGVYRCAVSVAGVSDLRRMLTAELRELERRDSPSTRYWTRFMGADGARDPNLDAISPARLASRASIPILLVHGKDDTVVRYEQSEIMAQALRDAGKPVEFVTLAGEDHWLSRGGTRLQMLRAVVDFLERNNPPK